MAGQPTVQHGGVVDSVHWMHAPAGPFSVLSQPAQALGKAFAKHADGSMPMYTLLTRCCSFVHAPTGCAAS